MNRNREAFQAFHEQHPEVFTEFCRRVEMLWDKGHRHYSSDGLLHAIRFHTAITGKPEEAFKINNNYSCMYARLWQSLNPSRESFFETRKQKSAQQ